MRPISDIFLAEKPLIATGESGSRETIKTTPQVLRVELDELELTYMHNPTIFNGVNKIVSTIMSGGCEIVAKDKKVQAYFNNFVESLGTSGSDINWNELLSTIFKHQCVYGSSWVENIFNVKGNRVVDWDVIDPKKMDYAKDSKNKIVLDEYGRPVGYFQKIPYNDLSQQYEGQDDSLPEGVVRPSGYKSIFLRPEQAAHIKFYTVGDAFYPVGLIEPIYKTSLRKLNVEEALANAVYRHGFPIIWAQLGDMNHEPTPQQIENMLNKLKDVNFKREIATPYYYQLHLLESKKAEKLREHLEYFKEQEVAGMGIPKPFATGGGESSNSAMKSQSSMFQLTLRDLMNKTSYAIEKYMFAMVSKYEGFNEIPKLKWLDVGTGDELERKARRILKYVEAGIIMPDLKMSEFIKKIEHLD